VKRGDLERGRGGSQKIEGKAAGDARKMISLSSSRTGLSSRLMVGNKSEDVVVDEARNENEVLCA